MITFLRSCLGSKPFYGWGHCSVLTKLHFVRQSSPFQFASSNFQYARGENFHHQYNLIINYLFGFTLDFITLGIKLQPSIDNFWCYSFFLPLNFNFIGQFLSRKCQHSIMAVAAAFGVYRNFSVTCWCVRLAPLKTGSEQTECTERVGFKTNIPEGLRVVLLSDVVMTFISACPEPINTDVSATSPGSSVVTTLQSSCLSFTTL